MVVGPSLFPGPDSGTNRISIEYTLDNIMRIIISIYLHSRFIPLSCLKRNITPLTEMLRIHGDFSWFYIPLPVGLAASGSLFS